MKITINGQDVSPEFYKKINVRLAKARTEEPNIFGRLNAANPFSFVNFLIRIYGYLRRM